MIVKMDEKSLLVIDPIGKKICTREKLFGIGEIFGRQETSVEARGRSKRQNTICSRTAQVVES